MSQQIFTKEHRQDANSSDSGSLNDFQNGVFSPSSEFSPAGGSSFSFGVGVGSGFSGTSLVFAAAAS